MRNVTKNDIIDMFRKFKSAYDARYTMPKMDTVDIWYECLKDCCDEFLNQATVECVKDCEFPPTIAHIFKAHERIREKWEKERLELQDWWEVAKGIYPKDLKDDEAPKILFEKIKKIDKRNICGVKLFMGSSTGNMLVDETEKLSEIFAESPVIIATHNEDTDIINQNAERLKNS